METLNIVSSLGQLILMCPYTLLAVGFISTLVILGSEFFSPQKKLEKHLLQGSNNQLSTMDKTFPGKMHNIVPIAYNCSRKECQKLPKMVGVCKSLYPLLRDIAPNLPSHNTATFHFGPSGPLMPSKCGHLSRDYGRHQDRG